MGNWQTSDALESIIIQFQMHLTYVHAGPVDYVGTVGISPKQKYVILHL